MSKPTRLSLNVISWLDCIWETELPSASKLIAAYLRSYMNAKHDMAWPSLARIVKETGLGQSTVCKHLEVLESSGWIKRNRGHGGAVTKATEYIACFPVSWEKAIAKIEVENSLPSPSGGEAPLHTIESPSPPNGVAPLHQTDTNTQVLNTQSNTQTTIVIPEGINIDSWNEWIAARKSRRKPVSPAAAKKQFKLLLRYSEIQQAIIIDKSISNDYQGLFDLKECESGKAGNGSPSHQRTDNSAVGRVRANAERERIKLASAGPGFNNPAMGADDRNVRPQVDESIRGRDRSEQCLGGFLEGDYARDG